MELQFKKNRCTYLTTVLREVQDQELTQEIRLSDGMPDAGHVVAAWGQPILRGKEWRGDSLSLTGGVTVYVLYAPEDGSACRCLEEWIPFRMKWNLPENTDEGQIRVNCLLRFADGRNVSPRKIMVRCGVSAQMEALTEGEKTVYMPEPGDTGVQLLKRSYPVRLFKEAGEKPFVLDEELAFPGSCPKPQEILYCVAIPRMTEKKVMADKAVFRGSCNLHILYRSEEGQLHTWDFELPISQFSQLRGEFGSDAGVDVLPAVTGLEQELSESGNIRVKCGLVAQYLIHERQMVDLVEDAYCPGFDLEMKTGELELPAILEARNESLFPEQKLHLETDVVVDNIFLPAFPAVRRTGTEMEVELPGVFQLLYYGRDGALKSSTAKWEGKLTLPSAGESSLRSELLAVNLPETSLGEDSVTVSNETGLHLLTVSQQSLPMVTGLTLGEQHEPDPGRPSLILCRSSEEDLWSLAKRYGTTEEAIRNTNGLENASAGGKMLLIPIP